MKAATEPKSVTGRDGYVVRKALAYAIECIERLPEHRQEDSDKEDMIRLLVAYSSPAAAADYRLLAIHHIEGRDLEVKDGSLVLSPGRANVVPFGPRLVHDGGEPQGDPPA